MSLWTWGWIAWLAFFGALETVAVVRSVRAKRAGAEDPRDTLSEHVWLWFGTGPRPKGPAVYVRRFVLLAFVVWLGVHFMTGGEFV